MKLRNVSDSRESTPYALEQHALAGHNLKIMQLDDGPVAFVEEKFCRIAGGSAGECYAAINLDDRNHPLCLKMYSITSRDQIGREYYFRNSLATQGFRAGTMVTAPLNRAMMVTDLAAGTAHDITRPVSAPNAARFLAQVGTRLAFMHAKKESHQDVKLENVLANEDEDGHLSFELNDFDVAFTPTCQKVPFWGGNRPWLAPERYVDLEKYPPEQWHKADVWSLANQCAMLLEMLPTFAEGSFHGGVGSEMYFGTCEAIRLEAKRRKDIGLADDPSTPWDLGVTTSVDWLYVRLCQEAWCAILSLPRPLNGLLWSMMSLDPSERPELADVVSQLEASGLLKQPEQHSWWRETSAQRAAKNLAAVMQGFQMGKRPTFNEEDRRLSEAEARRRLEIVPVRSVPVPPAGKKKAAANGCRGTVRSLGAWCGWLWNLLQALLINVCLAFGCHSRPTEAEPTSAKSGAR